MITTEPNFVAMHFPGGDADEYGVYSRTDERFIRCNSGVLYSTHRYECAAYTANALNRRPIR